MRCLAVLLAAICCAGLATACGSASKPSSEAKTNDTLAIEFARCMRAHGVANFPDPGQGSGRNSDANPNAPAFIAATKTCDKEQPNNSSQTTRPSKSRQIAMVKFAKCMRAHDVPNFPDPTLSTPPSNQPVIDAGGIYFVLPPGLDFQSPAVKQARTACGTGRGPL
jgi:hypothetical protein